MRLQATGTKTSIRQRKTARADIQETLFQFLVLAFQNPQLFF